MVKLGDVYGTGEWLKATNKARLAIPSEPESIVATIASIDTHTFENDDGTNKRQRVLHFQEEKIPKLGLNRTNWESIASFTGKDDDDGWVGERIEIFVVYERMSRTNHAVRVRKPSDAPLTANEEPFGTKYADALRVRLDENGVQFAQVTKCLSTAYGIADNILSKDIEQWPRSIADTVGKAISKCKDGWDGEILNDDNIPF